MISSHTRITEDDLVKWSYYRFYHKVSYISRINGLNRRLQDIYKRKNAQN